jgi:hypothetical protein
VDRALSDGRPASSLCRPPATLGWLSAGLRPRFLAGRLRQRARRHTQMLVPAYNSACNRADRRAARQMFFPQPSRPIEYP